MDPIMKLTLNVTNVVRMATLFLHKEENKIRRRGEFFHS